MSLILNVRKQLLYSIQMQRINDHNRLLRWKKYFSTINILTTCELLKTLKQHRNSTVIILLLVASLQGMQGHRGLVDIGHLYERDEK